MAPEPPQSSIPLEPVVYRLNANTPGVRPGDRGYNPALTVQIEEHRGRWLIATHRRESIWNRQTGEFDDDWTFRHTNDDDRATRYYYDSPQDAEPDARAVLHATLTEHQR